MSVHTAFQKTFVRREAEVWQIFVRCGDSACRGSLKIQGEGAGNFDRFCKCASRKFIKGKVFTLCNFFLEHQRVFAQEVVLKLILCKICTKINSEFKNGGTVPKFREA